MVEQIKDGGPAFPGRATRAKFDSYGYERGTEEVPHEGMTLRDYFAAKAMQALLVADGTTHFDQRAREAYDMASAMLAARGEA